MAVDESAAAEMVRISGQQGVPVIVIDGQVVIGFNRPQLDQLLEQARRPRLDAAVADAREMAAKGRCSAQEGAYVGRVIPGSVAERAGLQVGDVITQLANQPVSSALHLQSLLARLRPGQHAPLSYTRGDQTHLTTLLF